MTTEIKNTKKNQHLKVVTADPLEVLMKLKRLGRTQTSLTKLFKKTNAQISQAFSGKSPHLLNKLDKYLTKLLEDKKG